MSLAGRVIEALDPRGSTGENGGLDVSNLPRAPFAVEAPRARIYVVDERGDRPGTRRAWIQRRESFATERASVAVATLEAAADLWPVRSCSRIETPAWAGQPTGER